VAEARIHGDIARDTEVVNATNGLAAALGTDNGVGPNQADSKVHWSQLKGVPAGFADGTDDGGGGGDADAIHDNVSGEIAAIADKATPVVADHLLIEDSAASNAKKDITIGSLEAALEGVLDLQELQGAVTDGQVDAAIARDAEVAAGYQPLDSDLTDLADGSLSGSKVGSGIDAANVTTGLLPAARLAGISPTLNSLIVSNTLTVGTNNVLHSTNQAQFAVPTMATALEVHTNSSVWAGSNFYGKGDIIAWGTGRLVGNGIGVTNLQAGNIAAGTLADARLSANVSLLGQTITEGELSLSDVTTADVTTDRHGFVPKMTGSDADVLRGDGTWTTIPAGSDGGVQFKQGAYLSTDAGLHYDVGSQLLTTVSLDANDIGVTTIFDGPGGLQFDSGDGEADFGVLVLHGDGTGLSNLTATAEIENDSVILGTHTVGDYIETITGDSEIQVTGGGTEGRDVTLAIAASIARISDTAFASSWNGVTTTSPTKNAVYDWGHIFDTDDDGKVDLIDSVAGVATLGAAGALSVNTTDKLLGIHNGTKEVALSLIQHREFSFDPKAVCDGAVDRLFLFKVGAWAPKGITITGWRVSFEADPTTEVDLDLKRADAFIGVANSAVMDVLDTTAGASSETSAANINSGAVVATGKVVYLEFGTAYSETTHQVIFEIEYEIEED
jgi:hypothetical protein